MKKFSFYLIIFSIFLTSCQSIKDGLSGNKAENSDEFLVKKKNPLVMPPNYDDLPKPGETELSSDDQDYQGDVKKLLKVVENEKKESSAKNSSIEEFVIRNINKN